MRAPAVCPKCGSAVVVPEALLKPRRPFPAAAKFAAAKRGAMAALDPEVGPDALEAVVEEGEDDAEDEDEDEDE
jgi:hypothetical protein